MRHRPGVLCTLLAAAFLTPATARPQAFEIYHRFILPGGNPRGELLNSGDTTLYGTALDDGELGMGSIYRFVRDASGYNYEFLYSFHGPDGARPLALRNGLDGWYYGVTEAGGAAGFGTVFAFNPTTSELVQLHDFAGPDGKFPHDLVYGNGPAFYGTTFQGGASDLGTVFRIEKIAAGGALTTLHEFAPGEGANPSARMLASNVGLYGVTDSGGAAGDGTAFEIEWNGTFTTLHEFTGADGQNPRELTQTGPDEFWGTTCGGGDSNFGTVFRMDAAGAITTLHSFDGVNDGSCPYSGVVLGFSGNFYGVAEGGGTGGGGTFWHVEPDLSFHVDYAFPNSQPQDPHMPVAAPALGWGGFFYGTTTLGGSGQGGAFAGTLYQFDGTMTFLHDFGSVTGVRNPGGEIVEASDGNLYGTSGGGLRCCDFGPGTVYRLRAAPLLVHDFTFDEGEGPSSLLAASDGGLYGTSANNGPNSGGGTVWRVDPDGAFTLLHAFSFSDPGFDPAAGLTEGAGGVFYGSTKSPDGTVFSVDGSGAFTTLHAFTPPDGTRPQYGHLALAANVTLYGITGVAGAGGVGTVFRLGTDGTFTKLHDFTGADGANPWSNPIQAADGNLYGAALAGGSNGLGTLYRVDASDQFTMIHDFTTQEGGIPYASPVQATDGNLYGACTIGPTYGAGTVYRMDAAGKLTTIHEFDGQDGATPATRLLQAADGMLYGTASYGGPTNTGSVYRIDLANSAPSLASIAPVSGRAAGGVVLALSGDHLHGGAAIALAGGPAHASVVLDALSAVAVTPALEPGSLADVTVTNGDGQSATLPSAFFADFLDAPQDTMFHDEIEQLVRDALTVGCGAGTYCPDAPVTRAQMAAFLLKAEHGSGYAPPACTGVFDDVACPSMFADWIEQFAAEGLAVGCGGGNYCPDDPILRDQMSAFVLRTEHGAGYAPPACAGVFSDVSCPSMFADWIEQLAAEGITVGCGGTRYCPSDSTSRGQMAAFVEKMFSMGIFHRR